MPLSELPTIALAWHAPAPLAMLAPRQLKVSLRLPAPLLRPLGRGEQADAGIWSEQLAAWGWTWAIDADACLPDVPALRAIVGDARRVTGFDPRVVALAFALRLKVDGTELRPDQAHGPDLNRTWRALQALSADILSDALVLALLQGEARRAVFDLARVANGWDADVERVLSERRSLPDERSPRVLWLDMGYRLLGETFEQLRGLAETCGDCDGIWTEFCAARPVPTPFAMAFWWEAIYCLTERHALTEAQRAADHLAVAIGTMEAGSGLIDPLWHHQRGRMFYYAGDYARALVEVTEEYRAHGNNPGCSAMLNREVASILCDLASPDAAREYARRSLDVARAQGQRTEEFKTLGRLAEIAIKSGKPDEAREYLVASLAVQQRLNDTRAGTTQTLTYLGHAELLLDQGEAAEQRYDEAESNDPTGGAAAYILMGRMALARQRGEPLRLTQLWNAHRQALERWLDHPTLVLPASICVSAAAAEREDAAALLPFAIDALIDRHYPIEAATLTATLTPEDCSAHLARCTTTINNWAKTLRTLEQRLPDGPVHVGAIAEVIAWIRASHRDEGPLPAWSYPATLLDLRMRS